MHGLSTLTPAEARHAAKCEILLGRTPAARDLRELGFDAYVHDSVRDVVKKVRMLVADAGKLDRWNRDRALRHYVLYGALHRHAHNLDTFRWIYGRGGLRDSHPLAKFLSPDMRANEVIVASTPDPVARPRAQWRELTAIESAKTNCSSCELTPSHELANPADFAMEPGYRVCPECRARWD